MQYSNRKFFILYSPIIYNFITLLFYYIQLKSFCVYKGTVLHFLKRNDVLKSQKGYFLINICQF